MNTTNQPKLEKINRIKFPLFAETEFRLIQAIVEHFFMSESYVDSQKLKKRTLNSIFNLSTTDLLKALATSTKPTVSSFVKFFSTLDNKLQNDVFASLKQHKIQLILMANRSLTLKRVYGSGNIKMTPPSNFPKISLSNYK